MTSETLNQHSVTELLDYFAWEKEDSKIKIFLPNEIFNDLSILTNYRYRSFAYSFYYLNCYLYRNAKYNEVFPLSKLYSITLIELLYGSRKPVNFITKRGGVLESIGYTQPDNNFPLGVEVKDSSLHGFHMYQELEPHVKDALEVPSGFICHKPLKAFKRNSEDDYYTGTFFEFANTHSLDFRVFAKCLASRQYGFELFYLYGFLKAYHSYIQSKPKVFRTYVTKSLGFGIKKFNLLYRELESLNLIKINHETLLRYKIIKVQD